MHNSHESYKLLALLVFTGAALGLGKLLVSPESLTWRLIMGRVLLGSGASTVAGIGLIWIPDLHPLALVAIGSAFGIIGSAAIEAALKKYLAAQIKLHTRRATDKETGK